LSLVVVLIGSDYIRLRVELFTTALPLHVGFFLPSNGPRSKSGESVLFIRLSDITYFLDQRIGTLALLALLGASNVLSNSLSRPKKSVVVANVNGQDIPFQRSQGVLYGFLGRSWRRLH
jgi:hypothetical protein